MALPKLKLFKQFSTKQETNREANALRKQGVQFVRVRPKQRFGRKGFAIFIGGKKSSKFV